MNITKYSSEGHSLRFRCSVLIANDRGNAVSTVAKVAKSGFPFVAIHKYLRISINRIRPTWRSRALVQRYSLQWPVGPIGCNACWYLETLTDIYRYQNTELAAWMVANRSPNSWRCWVSRIAWVEKSASWFIAINKYLRQSATGTGARSMTVGLLQVGFLSVELPILSTNNGEGTKSLSRGIYLQISINIE